MKKLVLTILIVAICNICAAAQTSSALPENIAQMTNEDSLALLDDPVIKTRLEKLLSAYYYESFVESFETVSPVEKKGNFLFTSGCLIHACGQAESAIVIDLRAKTIHVAIYRSSQTMKFFNEKNKKTPKAIRDWQNSLTTK